MALPPRPMWQIVIPPIVLLIAGGAIGALADGWMVPGLVIAALVAIAYVLWATRIRGGLPPRPPPDR